MMKIPSAVEKILASHTKAKMIFEKLPSSHKNEYLKWIAEAKQKSTRQRRLEKLIPTLLKKSAK